MSSSLLFNLLESISREIKIHLKLLYFDSLLLILTSRYVMNLDQSSFKNLTGLWGSISLNKKLLLIFLPKIVICIYRDMLISQNDNKASALLIWT